ncbi:MAG: carboxypeptidase Taq [Solirubrobacteraceae bacterium]|jgi:carboxypeptidase Taq|nr:carboxypeptidase Taq [Solirubrobacteraceae bacterium]
MDALTQLRERMAELSDLQSLEMLAAWDQLVMMPSEGGAARAQQLATLARITHERSTDEGIGALLSDLAGAELSELDADIVRLARRDWERAGRVPSDLAADLSRAHAEGQERWQLARAEDDFAAFAPSLQRNIELAQAYAGCVAEGDQGAYDALLGDYDFGLRSEELRRLFSALADALGALVAEARVNSPRLQLEVPVTVQEAAVAGTLRRLGVDDDSWRVDVSTHPFMAEMSRCDTRLTTRYNDGNLESLLSSLHEYGHALYERQIDPALERTNLGRGTSMSIHESQSKFWENHVARHPAFAEVLAGELTSAGTAIAPGELHAALVGVEESLIRVSADPFTYPLHIILRFELERALIEGDLAVGDLPTAWRDGMRRLLGLEVPSDALGCLQDIHWAAGSFGYFPSYALGCLIAAQLWEAMQAELGSLEEDLRRAEVTAIQRWLGERVHSCGRRLDTIPLVEKATGRGLEIEPFLRYVEPLAAPSSGG